MAFIAVTYSFSNSTVADATQVNQNFQDIIDGLSNGTKDISVNAGTFAGNVSISGNTTIGNGSGDDITFTGSMASSLPIKTTNSFDIGSSTLGLQALYFGANSQTVNIKGSASMSATWTMTLPVSAGTDGYYMKTNGSGVTSWQAFTAPTQQVFTSGSGTYTTPANVKYIRVRMVGAGGGGGGGGTGAGTAATAGGNTTFGSSLLTANGGALGAFITGGDGGAATAIASPAYGTTIAGGDGSTYPVQNTSTNPSGGTGGVSFFGGAGKGTGAAAGSVAKANSGSGGGGGGGGSASYGGGGGGSGSYVEAIIAGPSSTYAYAVGAAGTGGGAGGSGYAGGNGAAGYIEVTEYYS